MLKVIAATKLGDLSSVPRVPHDGRKQPTSESRPVISTNTCHENKFYLSFQEAAIFSWSYSLLLTHPPAFSPVAVLCFPNPTPQDQLICQLSGKAVASSVSESLRSLSLYLMSVTMCISIHFLYFTYTNKIQFS